MFNLIGIVGRIHGQQLKWLRVFCSKFDQWKLHVVEVSTGTGRACSYQVISRMSA